MLLMLAFILPHVWRFYFLRVSSATLPIEGSYTYKRLFITTAV